MCPRRALTGLQTLLDEFDDYYNTQREHQSLPDRTTPAEAWKATAAADPPLAPAGAPLPPPPPRQDTGTATKTVQPNGCVTVLSCELLIGKHHAGTTAQVTWTVDTIEIHDTTGTYRYQYPRPPRGTHYLGQRARTTTTMS